jgi:ribonucleoside-diphosphate reductase alpha chain
MQPVEVFAKFKHDNRPEMVVKSTGWVTTCRLVSTSLRYGIPIAEIIKQLDRSAASMFDLPAQLAKLLKKFCTENGQSIATTPCPDCGDELIFTEGCEKCLSCGFSKCG